MIEEVLFVATSCCRVLHIAVTPVPTKLARTPTRADLARTALGIIFSMATR